MGTIANSLKKLVVKLGGASNPMDVPGNNISEVVDQITNIVNEAPSGASVFRIHVADGTAANTYVSDVSFEEVAAAIEADETLICDVDATSTFGEMHFTTASYGKTFREEALETVTFMFGGFTITDTVPSAFMVCITIADNHQVYINVQPLSVPAEPTT